MSTISELFTDLYTLAESGLMHETVAPEGGKGLKYLLTSGSAGADRMSRPRSGTGSMVERSLGVGEATGSIPVSPTAGVTDSFPGIGV